MKEHVLERRQHYRIEYPLQARPRLDIGTRAYQVLDVSERGLRLVWESGSTPSVGWKFHGVLTLANGDRIKVDGHVLRVEAEQISIQLSSGVPLSRIMSEQLYLLRSYGRPSAS